ncbi:Hsp20/alpha crystallin family protein [Rubrobacter taiwanensis]|jgi:HSP20 family protein|uniref:Hsp20/alpha crystallin family protein n=1 Tax=Rubrobacter taiwanensis TaxID=185139 RepID=A0A4R1BJ94_9ACTN|nr:Hsp20/alpha crystallin family protein [Rubrobacter taiwanensis]TCJ17390.1 Hsp20/alpha crystallin family protein [Rubrobacter taiwanensis]
MALSPFRSFRDLQSEMDRMMDDMFRSFIRPARRRGERSDWVPAVDVFNRGGDLVIRAELPGMKREDIDISLQNGVLTISGERRDERSEEGSGYLIRERSYGSFSRSMSLPDDVDESKIRATFKDGLLEVTVEGAAAVQEPRRIQIEG